jgi:hypothetical protein
MAAEPPSKPSFTPRRRWAAGFDITVRTLVVIAVLVMLNHLAALFFHRQYLSKTTKEELTPLTRNLLQSITNEVKVIIYHNAQRDDLYALVAPLLREYQALNPRITVRAVDYLRDVNEALGIKNKFKLPTPTDAAENNFVIFECEDRPRVMPGEALVEKVREVDWEKRTNSKRITAHRGETVFTAMLLSVINPKPEVAYVLMGHGEHNFTSGDEYTGYLDFKGLLEQNNVQVVPLALTGTNAVPADCNLLIIAGPVTTISAGELGKIEQYLNEGGRLLALLNFATRDRTRGLEAILEKWRVQATDKIVTDPKNSINSIKVAPGEDVTVGSFSKHPAVGALFGSYLNLYKPRAVGVIPAKENATDVPKAEVLFVTADSASLANPPQANPRAYPLAVAVEKNVVRGIVTSRGNTRMIVVGDSFFFANEPLKLVANREFATYALNWLLDRPLFTEGIGPKPFTEFRMTITETQMTKMSWLLLGAVPGGVLMFGVLVWWRRRN